MTRWGGETGACLLRETKEDVNGWSLPLSHYASIGTRFKFNGIRSKAKTNITAFSLAVQGGGLAFCQNIGLTTPDTMGSESQQRRDKPSAKAKAKYIHGESLGVAQKNNCPAIRTLQQEGIHLARRRLDLTAAQMLKQEWPWR